MFIQILCQYLRCKSADILSQIHVPESSGHFFIVVPAAFECLGQALLKPFPDAEIIPADKAFFDLTSAHLIFHLELTDSLNPTVANGTIAVVPSFQECRVKICRLNFFYFFYILAGQDDIINPFTFFIFTALSAEFLDKEVLECPDI